jgi:hypothetical protein
MPDGEHISVVRVEADGAQRLWTLTGTALNLQASVILPNSKRVGYYAWLDAATAALFVLGDGDGPSTLQLMDIRRGKTSVVATDIGRSLQHMPSGGLSFVQRDVPSGSAQPSSMITRLARDRGTGETSITPLIRPAGPGADPFVGWMPDGTALMAVDSTVYRWRSGETSWRVVADLGAFGVRDISRLAVSPDGRRLALVARAKRGTSIAQ